jgi:hypothetical protein
MVMVSHSHRFIFLKTRKTAGTSVEMALQHLCTPPGTPVTEPTPVLDTRFGIVGRRHAARPPWSRLIFWRKDWYNHMPADQIARALGRKTWTDYRKVATIRNPFDLAVSRYHFDLARRHLPEKADFRETQADFRDMVFRMSIDHDHDLVHLDGKFVCDEVILFEDLREQVARIARIFAPGTPAPELPHAKKTANRRTHPVAEYFDEASIGRILQTSGWVFDRFGYPDRP